MLSVGTFDGKEKDEISISQANEFEKSSIQTREELFKSLLDRVPRSLQLLSLGLSSLGIVCILFQLVSMPSELIGSLSLPHLHALLVTFILSCMRTLKLLDDDLAAAAIVGNDVSVGGLFVHDVPYQLVRGDNQRIEKVGLVWFQRVAPVAYVLENFRGGVLVTRV